eukprot:TRINITY_DN27089_c0_g1_i2.p1 TRINITY_DN27089_c0_g1~~TRINITY_DN27089_c0_g1_i2.p1  ORF type:complete len:825 (-),score=93.56 TRINITY_DN27089_c0_g1_i2:193-2400(-)
MIGKAIVNTIETIGCPLLDEIDDITLKRMEKEGPAFFLKGYWEPGHHDDVVSDFIERADQDNSSRLVTTRFRTNTKMLDGWLKRQEHRAKHDKDEPKIRVPRRAKESRPGKVFTRFVGRDAKKVSWVVPASKQDSREASKAPHICEDAITCDGSFRSATTDKAIPPRGDYRRLAEALINSHFDDVDLANELQQSEKAFSERASDPLSSLFQEARGDATTSGRNSLGWDEPIEEDEGDESPAYLSGRRNALRRYGADFRAARRTQAARRSPLGQTADVSSNARASRPASAAPTTTNTATCVARAREEVRSLIDRSSAGRPRSGRSDRGQAHVVIAPNSEENAETERAIAMEAIAQMDQTGSSNVGLAGWPCYLGASAPDANSTAVAGKGKSYGWSPHVKKPTAERQENFERVLFLQNEAQRVHALQMSQHPRRRPASARNDIAMHDAENQQQPQSEPQTATVRKTITLTQQQRMAEAKAHKAVVSQYKLRSRYLPCTALQGQLRARGEPIQAETLDIVRSLRNAAPPRQPRTWDERWHRRQENIRRAAIRQEQQAIADEETARLRAIKAENERVAAEYGDKLGKLEDCDDARLVHLSRTGDVQAFIASGLLSRCTTRSLRMAFFTSVRAGNSRILEHFITRDDCDVNWRESGTGGTALHIAAAGDHVSCYEVVELAGADTQALDAKGRRPIDVAGPAVLDLMRHRESEVGHDSRDAALDVSPRHGQSASTSSSRRS